MKQLIFITLIGLLLSNATFADEDTKYIPCSDSYYDEMVKPRAAFQKLHDVSKDAGVLACKNILQITIQEQVDVKRAMEDFALETTSTLKQVFHGENFDFINQTANEWALRLTSHYNDADYLGFIESQLIAPINDDEYLWQVYITEQHNINRPSVAYTDELNSRCKALYNGISDSECIDLFTEVEQAANPLVALIKENILTTNKALLTDMQKNWNLFLDEARYQTPLDIWATTELFSDQFKGKGLTGPPPIQYFIFHPTLVYEHIGGLPEGDKEDFAIAIEWYGMNWWKQKIGFSVVSTYKDKAETNDVSIGLMFHIDNAYSFGFTHRGSNDNGIFLNVDLLEFFGDKTKMYKKYKSKMFSQ